MSQPEADEPLGIVASGQSDTHTQEDSNSANRDLESQKDGDGGRTAASSGLSTRTREDLSIADGNAGNQPEADEPQPATSSSNSTHTQRSSSPTNSNAEGQLEDDLSRGIAGGSLRPNGAHGLNNVKEGLLAGLGTTGVPDRKVYSHGNDSPGVVRRRPSGGAQPGIRVPEEDGSKSASDNQTWLDPASEVQGTFNRRVGYGIGEGSQGTAHISTTSTSVQRCNTKGNFDGNYGSNNKYGDEYSNIVNERTIFNGGVINLTGPGRGEEPKNIGRLSTRTHTPTVYTSTVLTPRNIHPQ